MRITIPGRVKKGEFEPFFDNAIVVNPNSFLSKILLYVLIKRMALMF